MPPTPEKMFRPRPLTLLCQPSPPNNPFQKLLKKIRIGLFHDSAYLHQVDGFDEFEIFSLLAGSLPV
jgi:hypothetical protein